MKPVYQTNFDFKTGNCLAACVASILECSLDEVPNFCGEPDSADGDSWFDTMVDWLEDKGYRVAFWEWSSPAWVSPGTHLIVSGRSPRSKEGTNGHHHAVIVTRNESREPGVPYRYDWTHDPHPDGTFIEGPILDAMLLFKQDA